MNASGIWAMGFVGLCVGLSGVSEARSGTRLEQKSQPELRPEVAPVVASLRAAQRAAGAYAGLALPDQFAGAMVGTGLDDAARTATDPHYLNHTFEDGGTLFYYSDAGSDYLTLSAWESAWDGTSSYSLYGSIFEGSFASTSLGFSEGYQSGEQYIAEGYAAWQTRTVDAETGLPYSSAMVSDYASSYGVDQWSYQSTDHAYLDWSTSEYRGAGESLEGGTRMTLDAYSRTNSATAGDHECWSQGDTTYDFAAGYASSSDYFDSCAQLDGAGHFYEALTHVEYSWDPKTYITTYTFTSQVDCSDGDGIHQTYAVIWDQDTSDYRTVEVSSGNEVGAVGCAWDPRLDQSYN